MALYIIWKIEVIEWCEPEVPLFLSPSSGPCLFRTSIIFIISVAGIICIPISGAIRFGFCLAKEVLKDGQLRRGFSWRT